MKISRIYLMFVFVCAGMVVFSSCEKEKIMGYSDNEDQCADLLYFENSEEMLNELTKVLSLDLNEKVQWEHNKNFKSIALASELFYESIDIESFNNHSEAKEFIEKNKHNFEITDEDGEFSVRPLFYSDPLRYFINKDQIFQIGDRVYKVFDNALLNAPIELINEIKTMDKNDSQFYENDKRVIFIDNKQSALKSTQCRYGNYKAGDPIYGYRTTLEIKPKYFDNIHGSIAASWYRAECQIRRVGFWWLHQTKLYTTVRTQLVFHARLHGTQIVNTEDLNQEFPNVKYVERISGYVADILTGYNPQPYFNSYNGTCHSDAGVGTLDEGKAILNCN